MNEQYISLYLLGSLVSFGLIIMPFADYGGKRKQYTREKKWLDSSPQMRFDFEYPEKPEFWATVRDFYRPNWI